MRHGTRSGKAGHGLELGVAWQGPARLGAAGRGLARQGTAWNMAGLGMARIVAWYGEAGSGGAWLGRE